MTKSVDNYANQYWTIVPVAPAFNAAQAKTFAEQRWTLTLSGIALVDFQSGFSGANWHRDTIYLSPNTIAPLTHAMNSVGIPIPERLAPYLLIDQWSLFATINSIFDKNQSVNAGFAVDDCQPLWTGIIDENGDQVYDIFGGMVVDLAACDTDAWIYRIGYSATLVGRIKVGFVN